MSPTARSDVSQRLWGFYARVDCSVPNVLLSVCVLLLQFGVALASAGELSFNWLGFTTAMLSNLTFGFRAVWSKA